MVNFDVFGLNKKIRINTQIDIQTKNKESIISSKHSG